MRGTKVLVGVVIGLGVLIVLGTTVIVVTVAKRIAARHTPPVAASAPRPEAPHILGLAAAGGRLAVAVSGPAGDRLLLVDPANGQVVGQVALAP